MTTVTPSPFTSRPYGNCVIADSALYAQFRISFAHNAPRTLSEISVGTPAAISARDVIAGLRLLDDQFAATMMPDMPRPGHFGPDIHDGCDHFLWQQRAQSVRVLDAVLQRQHQRIRRKMRLDGTRTPFRVGGLHAKEHELRALHRAPFGAGRDANVFVEGLRFEPDALTLDRLDELRAPD